MSSFDSYIETIEMQGVCPTWLKSTQDQQALGPWTAPYRKRHRLALVHGHRRLNGLRTRSNPTRAAELEGDGGENGNFTLSIAYDVYSKAETTDALLAPKTSETGLGDARILSTQAETSLQPRQCRWALQLKRLESHRLQSCSLQCAG